jgi:hypothetical protein
MLLVCWENAGLMWLLRFEVEGTLSLRSDQSFDSVILPTEIFSNSYSLARAYFIIEIMITRGVGNISSSSLL